MCVTCGTKETDASVHSERRVGTTETESYSLQHQINLSDTRCRWFSFVSLPLRFFSISFPSLSVCTRSLFLHLSLCVRVCAGRENSKLGTSDTSAAANRVMTVVVCACRVMFTVHRRLEKKQKKFNKRNKKPMSLCSSYSRWIDGEKQVNWTSGRLWTSDGLIFCSNQTHLLIYASCLS